MPRAQSFDYLHNMRFHVVVLEEALGGKTVTGFLQSQGNQGNGGSMKEAGFSSVTIPESTLEAVEYREGQFLYTRKYPGHVTFNDVTMMRGVAMRDTGFFNWISTAIVGTAEYRVTLGIRHYHRADTLPGSVTSTNINLDNASYKQYVLYEALPVRHKLSSDLDATDSAVSIMELDVAYEYIDEQLYPA